MIAIACSQWFLYTIRHVAESVDGFAGNSTIVLSSVGVLCDGMFGDDDDDSCGCTSRNGEGLLNQLMSCFVGSCF